MFCVMPKKTFSDFGRACNRLLCAFNILFSAGLDLKFSCHCFVSNQNSQQNISSPANTDCRKMLPGKLDGDIVFTGN